MQLNSSHRLYVIGDIHGRLDLLKRLLQKIDADSAGQPRQLVFLGDYVDRGLESRGVINSLIALQTSEPIAPVILLGNHEQVMRTVLRDRNLTLMADWLRYGGRETLLSYGIMLPMQVNQQTLAVQFERFLAAVPPAHQLLLYNLPVQHTDGDYFFCHAGARGGIPLQQQTEHDLLWSRKGFLDYSGSFVHHGAEKIVVHGHTPVEQPEFMPNRIAIDTGAYASGVLTALVLEGAEKRVLQS